MKFRYVKYFFLVKHWARLRSPKSDAPRGRVQTFFWRTFCFTVALSCLKFKQLSSVLLLVYAERNKKCMKKRRSERGFRKRTVCPLIYVLGQIQRVMNANKVPTKSAVFLLQWNLCNYQLANRRQTCKPRTRFRLSQLLWKRDKLGNLLTIWVLPNWGMFFYDIWHLR